MLTCLRCGNEWEPRKASPKRCPGCQNPNWNKPRKRERKVQVVTQEEPETIEAMPIPEVFHVETSPIPDYRKRAESLLSKLI